MDAASTVGGNSYSYGIGYSTTGKGFVIESDSSGLTQLDILWASGINSASSAASLLGYEAEDDTGALSYASDSEVGEGTLHIELGSTFTIDDTNNMIDFSENLGPELTATLTEGTYTVKELQAALETALETVSSIGVDYTVSYDAAAQKFSIAGTGGGLSELQLLWSSGDNTATSAASILGFDSVDDTGAMTYTADNETATVVDIAVKATDTLEDVAEAINDSDAEITASVILTGDDTYVLSLSSQVTGADNVMNITVTDTDGDNTDINGLSRLVFDAGVTENLTQTQASRDAILSVDGVDGIERASNTVTDVITGVTLTLKQAHENPATESDTVTITRDTNAISEKMTAFVDAYNEMLEFFSKYQQKYDEEEETAGVLVGDSTTNLIRNTLRRKISDTVSGLTSLSRLADVGIALNQDDDPRLELDSDTLNTALSANFEDVRDFFTRTTEGSEGFAVRLMDSIDGMLDSYNGILSARKSGITTTMGRIETKIDTLESKIETTEANLWTRFNSLELLLANYQTTADYLTQQLASLQNLSTSISGG
jgi:flagellar hook-associated protein 2